MIEWCIAIVVGIAVILAMSLVFEKKTIGRRHSRATQEMWDRAWGALHEIDEEA